MMMLSESDLLKSLDDEPRTPPTIDVRRAIAVGRRRVVRRGAGYAGAAAATAVAVAGAAVTGGLVSHDPSQAPATGALGTGIATSTLPRSQYTIPGNAGWTARTATPPTSCTLSKLTAPSNAPMALVAGADSAGRYIVGRSYPKASEYQAVLWHDGTGRNVMLPGNLEELLTDVNSAGTAVGWSYTGTTQADTGPVPYVYRDAKVSKLPGVRHGFAYAINDAGVIAGADDDRHTAVIWPSATAKPILLPVPDGTKEATARDIDEDGTTVGNLDNTVPYVWFPDGTHRELPLPSLDGKPAATAQVFSVRNGWATGVATNGAGRSGAKDPIAKASAAKASALGAVPVRWNLRTGEVSVTSVLHGPASAVNAQGWQIGTNQQGRAVLVAGTATVVLPDLATHTADGLSTIPTTVSDDGRTITGQSDDATGTIQAVVWHCQ
jgi:uncharacterized membrane protein